MLVQWLVALTNPFASQSSIISSCDSDFNSTLTFRRTSGFRGDSVSGVGSEMGNEKHAPLFTIRHYAGEVTYSAEGFLPKHQDSLFPDLVALMCNLPVTNCNAFVRSLFSKKMTGPPVAKPRTAHSSSRRRVGGTYQRSRGRKHRARSVLGAVTLGTQFKQNLVDLMEELENTRCHYVRCIKPNDTKSSHGACRSNQCTCMCWGRYVC